MLDVKRATDKFRGLFQSLEEKEGEKCYRSEGGAGSSRLRGWSQFGARHNSTQEQPRTSQTDREKMVGDNPPPEAAPLFITEKIIDDFEEP